MAELTVTQELIDGRARAVVTHAPERTTINPVALATIARGGGRDAVLFGRTLTMGTAGHGEGVVSYRVGLFEPIVGAFKLRKCVFPELTHEPLVALSNDVQRLLELLNDAVTALEPHVPDVAAAIRTEMER